MFFILNQKCISSVVHIYFSKNLSSAINSKIFIKIVKASFGNRRKTLKNSLSNSIFGDLDFAGSKIDLSLRAEQLDIEQFVSLALHAQNYRQTASNKIIA